MQEKRDEIKKRLYSNSRPADQGADPDVPVEMLHLLSNMDQQNKDHFKGVIQNAMLLMEREIEKEINKAETAGRKKEREQMQKEAAEKESAEKEAAEKEAKPPEGPPEDPKKPPEGPLPAGPSSSNAGVPRPRQTRVATPNKWKFMLPENGAVDGLYALWKPEQRKFSVQFASGSLEPHFMFILFS